MLASCRLASERLRGARGLDGGHDAAGRDGGHGQFDAQVLQRIVDGIGDGSRGSNGAALAHALLPPARIGRRRLDVEDTHVGHLAGAGQHVIGQRRGLRLAVGIEAHLFVERGADALGAAAVDLAVDDHWVDEHAAVLDHDVIEDLGRAGLRIHSNDGRVSRVAERAGITLGLVASREFEPAGIDIRRQILRSAVPGAGDVRDRHTPRGPDHEAVFQAHVLALGLHERGADLQDALGQGIACRAHGAARHDHGAGAPGSRRVGRLAGVAVHELDAIVRDAEDFMRHLGKRRFHALPVAVGTDAQFQAAISRETGLRLLEAGHEGDAPGGIDAGAVARLLRVHGVADADATAVLLALRLARAHRVVAHGLDGHAEGLGVVATVEMALGNVVERHLVRLHQALEAEFVRIAADLARERVQGHFQREADACAGDTTVRQDRRLVGRHRIDLAAVVREIVEARQDGTDLAGLETGRKRIGGVGTGIDRRLAIEGQQASVRVGIGGQDVVVLAAVRVGGEVFAPILQPTQRPAQLARRKTERHFLGQQNALVAEPAADIGRNDAHLLFREPQAFGQPRAHDVGLLAGRGEHQLAFARIPFGDDAAAFHRAHDLARGDEFLCHQIGGLGLRGLEVHIDKGGEIEIVAPMLVHEHAFGPASCTHIDDGRQRLELDVDLGCHVLGFGPRLGGTQGDEFAHVAHLAGCQGRLHGRLEAWKRRIGANGLHALQVVGDQHAIADGIGDADGFDAGMRDGAAEESHLQHAGDLYVAHVLAAATHIAIIFLARHRRTDALPGCSPRRPSRCPHQRASAMSSMLRRTQSPG